MPGSGNIPKKAWAGAPWKSPPAIVFLVAVLARIAFLLGPDSGAFIIKYPYYAHLLGQGTDIGERLLDLSPFYLGFFRFCLNSLGLGYAFIEAFQLLLGAFSCVLLYWIGKKILPKSAAFTGAMAWALYGNAIVLESLFEPFVFVVFFGFLTLWCLVSIPWTSEKKSLLFSALAGMFTGLCVITKPNFILFAPLAFVWFGMGRKNKVRLKTKGAMAFMFLAAAFFVILPISLCNHARSHDFVLVTADFGKVFFHGNARLADGFRAQNLPKKDYTPTDPTDPDPEHALFRQKAREITGKHLSPSQASRFWARQAFSHIQDRTWPRIMALFGRKALLFFHNHEIHLTVSAHRDFVNCRPWPFLPYGLLACFGLLGMVLGLGRFRELFLVYAVVCTYFFSGVLLLVTSRYRAPATPFLCLFAGLALVSLWNFYKKKQVRKLSAALIFLVIAACASHLPFKKEISQDKQMIAAQKDIPSQLEGHRLMARLFMARSNPEYAAKHFQVIALILPQDQEANKALGHIYLDRGDMEKAAACFKKLGKGDDG